MAKRGVVAFVVVVLFALTAPLSGQKEPGQEPRIRVWIPGRYNLVSVDLWVYSAEDPLFVPYCGTDEEGGKHLCALATHLEKKTPQGWRKAQVRNATMTGKPLVFASGDLIPPRSKDSYTFTFSTDAFGIPPGTRLRVVVDTWSSLDGMRSGAPPTRVISPEFVCPP
jgi:hypothetical protein